MKDPPEWLLPEAECVEMEEADGANIDLDEDTAISKVKELSINEIVIGERVASTLEHGEEEIDFQSDLDQAMAESLEEYESKQKALESTKESPSNESDTVVDPSPDEVADIPTSPQLATQEVAPKSAEDSAIALSKPKIKKELKNLMATEPPHTEERKIEPSDDSSRVSHGYNTRARKSE